MEESFVKRRLLLRRGEEERAITQLQVGEITSVVLGLSSSFAPGQVRFTAHPKKRKTRNRNGKTVEPENWNSFRVVRLHIFSPLCRRIKASCSLHKSVVLSSSAGRITDVHRIPTRSLHCSRLRMKRRTSSPMRQSLFTAGEHKETFTWKRR